MGSLRLRWGIGVVVAALPLAAMACTSDQFVGADGGSDATTSDGPTTDAPTTSDGAASDAPIVKDSSILDGGIGVGEASCIYDGGILESCGSSSTCFSGTHYCNVGACTFVPDPCVCDHSCNCVEKSAADPCAGGDAGTRQCSDQNGYVVVWCSP